MPFRGIQTAYPPCGQVYSPEQQLERNLLRMEQSRKESLQYQLERLEVNVEPDWNSARLAVLLVKAQQGLLAYTNCSATELLLFCRQRQTDMGVLSKDYTKESKGELVASLEQADAEWKFARFLDLPAELRKIVYEYTTPHSVDGKVEKVWPLEGNVVTDQITSLAITKVSRLLHAEALPIFVASNTFGLSPHTPCAITRAKSWLSSVGEDAVKNIGRVALAGTVSCPHRDPRPVAPLMIIVDMRTRLANFYHDEMDSCAKCAKEAAGLSELADRIPLSVLRKGKMKLSVNSLIGICEVASRMQLLYPQANQEDDDDEEED